MVDSSRRPTPPLRAITSMSPWCLALILLIIPNAVLLPASAFSIRPPPTQTNNNAIQLLHRLPPLFSSKNDDTDNLLEKARKLRQEVSAIESSKAELQQEKDAKEQKRQAEEEEARVRQGELRMRYSVEVPILKDMGEEVMERVDFPPRLKGGKSRILAVQAPLPLGLVLGQDITSTPILTTVDEVSPDSNGDLAQIKQGDIVRAVTACQTTMETPTWQLLAGGIGQPKTKRFIYSVDGRPLEEVLDAVGSNRMDVNGRDVWLVLERMD